MSSMDIAQYFVTIILILMIVGRMVETCLLLYTLEFETLPTPPKPKTPKRRPERSGVFLFIYVILLGDFFCRNLNTF